ncbi:MAG: hypothetical protein QXJ28_02880, partial [Candidatus Pacearchaeota archaeon]
VVFLGSSCFKGIINAKLGVLLHKIGSQTAEIIEYNGDYIISRDIEDLDKIRVFNEMPLTIFKDYIEDYKYTIYSKNHPKYSEKKSYLKIIGL